MSEKLLRWFEARREVRAIQMIRQSSVMATDVIEDLMNAIKFSIDGRIEETEQCYKRLGEKEIEADSLRRTIIEEIAKGELPPIDRTDLMRLARQIDLVIDWIHESGRILILLRLSETPIEIRTVCVEICETLRECTQALKSCISLLAERKAEEALDQADKVERFEEHVDSLYEKARRQILTIDASKMSSGAIILLSQFLDALENIADRCEDTCDQVRVIAVGFPPRGAK
ncbi:DUF47 family protein [Candidatus Bathyarchaeota archaeon]|nr:DUF47 family protein [Candidatus Bathyarchaeota archaeon]